MLKDFLMFMTSKSNTYLLQPQNRFNPKDRLTQNCRVMLSRDITLTTPKIVTVTAQNHYSISLLNPERPVQLEHH